MEENRLEGIFAVAGALFGFIGGLLLGYCLHIQTLPRVEVLGKTDGALCFAQAERAGDGTGGPHWLVRADGICYVSDMPR